jgi:ketosteroid isomerase-like protein
MSDRIATEALLLELYAARVEGPLDRLCAVFTDDAHFEIAGASDGKPIAISADGIAQIRPWLAVMTKTFRLADHEILSILMDGSKASVHWRANIHSRITGSIAPTELVDLVEVRDRHIASYVEFFVPR